MLYKNKLNEYLLSLSPTILWEMSDASGSGPVDLSGNGTNGTFTNVATSNSPGIMIDGVAQGCRFFGNSTIVSQTKLFNFSDGVTVCFFCRPVSDSGNVGFMCLPMGGANDPFSAIGNFVYDAAGTQGQYPSGDTGSGLSVVSNGAIFTSGMTDYFVLASTSQSFTNPYLALNGVPRTTLSANITQMEARRLTSWTAKLTLGRSLFNYWQYWFTGWMANFCMFNRALTASEIANINALAMTGAMPVTGGATEGGVYVDGVASSKRVFSHARNTGALIGSTRSGSDGVFSIPYPSTLSGQQAVLTCLDDTATAYEALAIDRVPLG